MKLMLATLVAVIFVAPMTAHDLWLIPPTEASIGKPASIHARSGMTFPVSEHAPDPAKFGRRVAVKPDGGQAAVDAGGTVDQSGVLTYSPTTPGLHIIAVETTPKSIRLEADDFNSYLVSDGLPHIFLLRSKEGSLNKPAVERYSKSPKVLFRVGTGPGDATKAVGLPLEIVPLKDPFALKPGSALPVRVLFRQRPLGDAYLGWTFSGGDAMPTGTVRTDSRGEALVPIAKSGLFTIRLTHMTRPNAADFEWESFWTTLTWTIEQ